MSRTAGLTFDPEGHVYKMNGQVVPGVTRVLGILRDFSKIPREVLENKAELGTLVDQATGLEAMGDLDPATVDPEIRGYMRAWNKFREDVQPQILSTQEPIYHFGLGYAGTLDHRVVIREQMGILDKKISPPDTIDGVQLSAYWHGWANGEALSVKQRSNLWALHLRENGTYKLVPYGDMFHVFTAALTCYRFKNGNGG